MRLQEAKILVEKINVLLKNMSSEGAGPSSIERDLMLSYIRDLYEIFLKNEVGDLKIPDSSSSVPIETKKEPEKTSPPIPEPTRRQYVPPRIIEIPDFDQDSSPIQETKQDKKPERKEFHEKPVVKSSSRNVSDPKIKELFSFKEATELSEKLSEQPINDLNKAFSINDRLLFINDLFNKDASKMNQVLNDLNGLSSMKEAEPYLAELAKKYHWTHEERTETAKAFIKLVKRRYV